MSTVCRWALARRMAGYWTTTRGVSKRKRGLLPGWPIGSSTVSGSLGSQPGRLASLTGIILGAKVGENKDVDIGRLFEAIARNQDRRRGVRALRLFATEKVPGRFAVELKRFARLEELGSQGTSTAEQPWLRVDQAGEQGRTA
jgi:hypothetical protein